MTLTKNATRVKTALARRGDQLFAKAAAVAADSMTLESYRSTEEILEPYARALSVINDHITVPKSEIDEAAAAYDLIANRLVERLGWPRDAIRIHPQGSASTRTLIRAPGAAKFDIDAVCEVDISRIEARDPMAFFDAAGQALDGLDVEKKKRCWCIKFAEKRFYLEFTPSVPLATVPAGMIEIQGLRAFLEAEYEDTALAVVDTPTQRWKTSNPAGLCEWIEKVAGRALVASLVLEELRKSATAGVTTVPNQSVKIDETLRVAIRLFKRHRDMCVRRGLIDSETQPISIILVTLLTICYDGLADLIEAREIPMFPHPVDVLIGIADLLPNMIPPHPDFGYSLINPTVHSENFAEKWNHDDGERADSFATWCGILKADLVSIRATADPREIEKKAREVFGCPADSKPGHAGGPGPATGVPRPPSAAPRTSGLA